MPEITIDIEVYCQTCGTGLCQYSEGVTTLRRSQPSIRVEACHNCIKQAHDDGYDKGRASMREEIGE